MQTQQPNNNNIGNNKNKPSRFNPIMWIYFPLLALLMFMWFNGTGVGDPIKTEWYKVKEEMIPQGDVEKILFVTNTNEAEVTIKQDSVKKYKNLFGGREPKVGPHFFFGVSESFNPEQQFEEARASLPADKKFEIVTEKKANYWGILDWIIFPLLLFAYAYRGRQWQPPANLPDEKLRIYNNNSPDRRSRR